MSKYREYVGLEVELVVLDAGIIRCLVLEDRGISLIVKVLELVSLCYECTSWDCVGKEEEVLYKEIYSIERV